MDASGGLWLRPFLSAWSLTETGPNCTGTSDCPAAGCASSKLPNRLPERERPLRDADMQRPLQGSAFSTWLASLMAFGRKGLAWYAGDETARPIYLVRISLPLLVRRRRYSVP